jgi:hypothetical protein
MKTCGGGGRIVPRVLNLGHTWRRVVRFTRRYPPESGWKGPQRRNINGRALKWSTNRTHAVWNVNWPSFLTILSILNCTDNSYSWAENMAFPRMNLVSLCKLWHRVVMEDHAASIFRAWTSETSASYHNTTRRHNTEDLDLNLHRRSTSNLCTVLPSMHFMHGTLHFMEVVWLEMWKKDATAHCKATAMVITRRIGESHERSPQCEYSIRS